MSQPIETLGDALPREITRVRDDILPVYDSFEHGKVAAAMMRADLDRASKAMIAGDLPAMIAVYESLKGYTF